MLRRVVMWAIALTLLSTAALAVTVQLEWVEVDISLHTDGKATFVYKVRYNVIEGPLHGFYLEGFGGATPYFDYNL